MDPSVAGAPWVQLVVPVTLLAIMVSMGMELALADFRRVVEMPRAAIVGLAGQMLLLPSAGLALAHWPGFPPEVAVGVVIITACPGGATSNVFSYLARANTALSITLTSLSSTLCFVTIPFWIGVGLDLFGAGLAREGPVPELPIAATAARLFLVTLFPVAIGMAIRARWPGPSARLRDPLRRSMTIVMVTVLLVIVGSEWKGVLVNVGRSAPAALGLVMGMLAVAWVCARAARLSERDAFTISIEVGLQNSALATTVVVSLLARPELIAFPGAYALLSFLPVTAWVLAMRPRFARQERRSR